MTWDEVVTSNSGCYVILDFTIFVVTKLIQDCLDGKFEFLDLLDLNVNFS